MTVCIDIKIPNRMYSRENSFGQNRFVMKTLGEILGLSKHNEILLLTLLGICYTIFDPAIFTLHSNLHKVWSVRMDPLKFNFTVQLYVKYIISTIVLVKTFTVHIYLAFYIVMLWPAIFEERPGLLLPWLIVASIKCLLMGVMTLSTGLYICMVYKFSKTACWDFILTQIIDQGPSLYMWLCVLSYYKHLKLHSFKIHRIRSIPSTLFDISARRKRVKSLALDLNSLNDDRHLLSTSTFDTLLHQLNAKCSKSRSLDSLLTKMVLDENKEFFKMSDVDLHDEVELSLRDRALKSLNVSESYMTRRKDINKIENLEQSDLRRESSHSTDISETEIKSIFLDANLCKETEKLTPKASKLPIRKTTGTSYTLLTKEKYAGCDTPRPVKSKTSTCSTNTPQRMFNYNAQNTKAASVSRAVTANRPLLQKSKSFIPKTETNLGSKVVHTPFKQDGYTLAYLEKVKMESIQRVRNELINTGLKGNLKE